MHNYMQVIYEFAMFVTWITFGYKEWNSIHRELGRSDRHSKHITSRSSLYFWCRLFKTPAFNRDMRVKGESNLFTQIFCHLLTIFFSLCSNIDGH